MSPPGRCGRNEIAVLISAKAAIAAKTVRSQSDQPRITPKRQAMPKTGLPIEKLSAARCNGPKNPTTANKAAIHTRPNKILRNIEIAFKNGFTNTQRKAGRTQPGISWAGTNRFDLLWACSVIPCC